MFKKKGVGAVVSRVFGTGVNHQKSHEKKMRSSTTKVTSQPMTEVKSAAESYGGVRLVMMTWGYQN